MFHGLFHRISDLLSDRDRNAAIDTAKTFIDAHVCGNGADCLVFDGVKDIVINGDHHTRSKVYIGDSPRGELRFSDGTVMTYTLNEHYTFDLVKRGSQFMEILPWAFGSDDITDDAYFHGVVDSVEIVPKSN